jgi:hypothetical protein
MQIADLFTGLGPRSRASVDAALRLRQTPHADAILVIQIPGDAAKPCEIVVFTGPVTVSVDTWKMGAQK